MAIKGVRNRFPCAQHHIYAAFALILCQVHIYTSASSPSMKGKMLESSRDKLQALYNRGMLSQMQLKARLNAVARAGMLARAAKLASGADTLVPVVLSTSVVEHAVGKAFTGPPEALTDAQLLLPTSELQQNASIAWHRCTPRDYQNLRRRAQRSLDRLVKEGVMDAVAAKERLSALTAAWLQISAAVRAPPLQDQGTSTQPSHPHAGSPGGSDARTTQLLQPLASSGEESEEFADGSQDAADSADDGLAHAEQVELQHAQLVHLSPEELQQHVVSAWASESGYQRKLLQARARRRLRYLLNDGLLSQADVDAREAAIRQAKRAIKQAAQEAAMPVLALRRSGHHLRSEFLLLEPEAFVQELVGCAAACICCLCDHDLALWLMHTACHAAANVTIHTQLLMAVHCPCRLRCCSLSLFAG